MTPPKRPVGSRRKRDTVASATDGVSANRKKAARVYQDFEIWTNKKHGPRKWHPVKKMRYVFFRMIAGKTITDAMREIHWNQVEFWSLVEVDSKGPFADEYNRAKRLQSRAMADSVITISEGRDSVSREAKQKLVKIILRGMQRAMRRKGGMSEQHAKVLLKTLLARINIEGYDSVTIQRNKLQMDAKKYLAKMMNPAEFGDASKLSLGSPPGDGGNPSLAPITIQFVGPDGKVVKP